MALLFDLLMIGILAYSLWRGYKRGVIRSLIRLGLAALSVFGASRLTKAITPVLSEALPMPGMGTKLSSFVATTLIEDPLTDISELMRSWGFCSKAATGIENFVLSRSDDFERSIAKTLSEYVDSLMTETVIFAFILLTFLIIALFLYMMISNALDRSALSLPDRIVGTAVAALMAFASILLICFFVSWTLPLIDASFDTGFASMICERSFLISATEKINPFYLLIG